MNIASVFPTYDILTIPTSMSVYKDIITAIAFVLVGILFIMSVLQENIKAIGGEKTEYKSLIIRLIIVFISLILYKHIFIKIVAICEAISMSLFNIEDFGKIKEALYQKMTTSDMVFNILKFNITDALTLLFIMISLIFESIALFIRYCLLSASYIIGPLAIISIIWKPIQIIFKGWITLVFQLSFWIIVLRILEATMMSLNLNQSLTQGNDFGFVLVAVLMTALIFISFFITERLLSQAHVGAIVGAIVMSTQNIAGNIGKVRSMYNKPAGTGSIKGNAFRNAKQDTKKDVIKPPTR